LECGSSGGLGGCGFELRGKQAKALSLLEILDDARPIRVVKLSLGLGSELRGLGCELGGQSWDEQ
jgi:hypothetical protein